MGLGGTQVLGMNCGAEWLLTLPPHEYEHFGDLISVISVISEIEPAPPLERRLGTRRETRCLLQGFPLGTGYAFIAFLGAGPQAKRRPSSTTLSQCVGRGWRQGMNPDALRVVVHHGPEVTTRVCVVCVSYLQTLQCGLIKLLPRFQLNFN